MVSVLDELEPIVSVPVLELVISPPAATVRFPLIATLAALEVTKFVRLTALLSIVTLPAALLTVSVPDPKDDGKNAAVEEIVVVPLKMTFRFVPVVGTKFIVPAVNVSVAPLPTTTFAAFALVIEPSSSTRAAADEPKLNFAVPVDPQSMTAAASFNVKPSVIVTVVFTPTAVPTIVKVFAAASVTGAPSVGSTSEL
jgi:hypothetical protein